MIFRTKPDLAASEINQNLVFKLRDRERQLLAKIDEALARIDDGGFGTCADCEEPIEVRRLEARPVSTLSASLAKRSRNTAKKFTLNYFISEGFAIGAALFLVCRQQAEKFKAVPKLAKILHKREKKHCLCPDSRLGQDL